MNNNPQDFNPRDIKAIAFDLDGTLLQKDKTLSARTKKAAAACRERGVRLIIATGRAASSGEVYRRELDLSGPQIYYNGAEVVDAPSNRLIYSRFVPVEPIRYCVEIARELGVYLQVYFPLGAVPGAGEVLMAERLGAESDFYRVSSGVQAVRGNLEEALASPRLTGIIKALFITLEAGGGKGARVKEQIRALINERYGNAVYVVASQTEYLEVLNAGVSKGTGLAHALRYLGIAKENTLAFGDEENDLPLFAEAAWSAAPANAKPAVKDAAVFRIPANTEDGVADFLEKRVLGPGA
ncbi:MAG: HAD hydrolase family protein [Treponema sp.]|jgi:hydroxymethylpyrimidine pyrophosphatase-like HAD family hydrolase|nr:HAD hydrolase family protein [Treponema sp.]